MANDEPALQPPTGAEAAAAPAAALAAEDPHAPLASPAWSQEPELPPRPRRRLLGAGAHTGQVLLIGVLLTACGFIGGVLVEKGQTGSAAPASGLASRLSALRGGAAAGGASGAAATGRPGSGGFAGRLGAAGGSVTIGEVAFVSGATLYVSDAEGATVKVKTSAASSITRTVKTSVRAIHPGDTVVVRGASGAGGALAAESVAVSEGTAGGGLGALFGGGGAGAGGSASARGGGGANAAGGGGAALFGE